MTTFFLTKLYFHDPRVPALGMGVQSVFKYVRVWIIVVFIPRIWTGQ